MYACAEDDMKNAEKHLQILSGHCNGKETCTVTACDDFFGIDPACGRKTPQLWLIYRCDGSNTEHNFRKLDKNTAVCSPPGTLL